MGDLARNWKKLAGGEDWKGLLDPLHIDLRRYIIHYGERAGAIDDVFIGDDLISPPKSENVGRPRYARSNLFTNVGLANGNPYKYVVKKYVYAAPKVAPSTRTSNLLAYVAVSTDEGTKALGRRDILIAWRGTKLLIEAGTIDAASKLRTAPDILGDENMAAKVHTGWYDYYTNTDSMSPMNKTSCREQVLEAVKQLIDEYTDETPEVSITITGRGTGAAIGILNAMDIVCKPLNYPRGQPNNACPVTAIVFGCPRLGNQGFGNLFSKQTKLQILRVTNDQDPIPKSPPADEYIHIGTELRINTLNSPYLKEPKETVHELEVYLHGVAGTQGINSKKYEVEGIRDIVLVNKTLDGLKDEYAIVPEWFTVLTPKNKFVVQNPDTGSWTLLDDPEEDED